MKIGVLALQGAFIEHISAMQQIGVEARTIRLPNQLDNLDGLIIPGGESISILQLMQSFGLVRPLRELASADFLQVTREPLIPSVFWTGRWFITVRFHSTT